jgi:osmotically-inducible protein OsmY
MTNPRTLLAIVLLALMSVVGCQAKRSNATVDVPTGETPEDQALSKSVLNRLLADNKADLTGIRVVSNDGKVYLSGTVKSLDARQQAIKIVWESPGVRGVVNGLQVQKQSN